MKMITKAALLCSILSFSTGAFSQGFAKKLLGKTSETDKNEVNTASAIEFLDAKKQKITKINNSMDFFYVKYSIPANIDKTINLDEKPELYITIKSGNVTPDFINPEVAISQGKGNTIGTIGEIIKDGSVEYKIDIKSVHNDAIMYLLENDETLTENLKKGKQTLVLNISGWSVNKPMMGSPQKVFFATGDMEFEIDGGVANSDNVATWRTCYKSGNCAPSTTDKAFINRCLGYAKSKIKNSDIVHIAPKGLKNNGTQNTFDCYVTFLDASTGKLQRQLFAGAESTSNNTLVSFTPQTAISEIPLELKEEIRNVK